MKTIVGVLIPFLIIGLLTSVLTASGTVGLYGIVSKVVFEPNETAPERIQIWGAFMFVDGGAGGKTLAPRRGYLYFALPSASEAPYPRLVALKEWADFKAIAGTGQAVAFGRFGYGGVFSEALISPPAGTSPSIFMPGNPANISHPENPVRPESMPPTQPSIYPLNIGLTKLSATGDLAAVVKELQDALKK